MNYPAAALSLFLLLLSAISGLLLLSRIRQSASLWGYIPLLIEFSLALLLLGVAVLPQEFPSLFQYILGHSIASDYAYPQQTSGTRVTETWISARWWKPIGTVFSLAMAIGLAWSIWNLRKKAERMANALALAIGILWMIVTFMNTLSSIAF